MSRLDAPSPLFDELAVWATPETLKADLLAAKAEWFSRTGEVFDDDRQLELRMTGFLEHYVCERVRPDLSLTPARARYELALREEAAPRAAQWRPFTETTRGLFEVRELNPGRVRLRSLFNDVDFEVTERRQINGLTVGDVLEARLLPVRGRLHFTQAYVWHPHAAAPLIRAEAARRRQAGSPELEFAAECAQRSLKAERYRQIGIEKIYDFTSKKL